VAGQPWTFSTCPVGYTLLARQRVAPRRLTLVLEVVVIKLLVFEVVEIIFLQVVVFEVVVLEVILKEVILFFIEVIFFEIVVGELVVVCVIAATVHQQPRILRVRVSEMQGRERVEADLRSHRREQV
jgi:hypothetical protein